MIVFSFLALTLLLALLALQSIRRSLTDAPSIQWPMLIMGLSLSLFTYLYGAWIYISSYGKQLFGAAVVAMTIYGLLRRSKGKMIRSHPQHSGVRLFVSLILLGLAILYFTGTAGRTHYAHLAFPLSKGRYFVLQGGKGLPANVFHFNSRRAVYAMDIVALDGFGRRCRKVFSKKLHDYYIFGDTVYSPCDGLVQRAVSDNPDNIPPSRRRGPHNLNGVVIEGQDYTVYLGHLQQHKVFVRAGQRLKAAQPVGLVGNSGRSLEPHLHIQAHRRSRTGQPWYEQPQLFIKFDAKEYLLFEEIDKR